MIRGPRNRILASRVMVLMLLTVGIFLVTVVIATQEGDAAPNLYVETADIVPEVPQPTKGTTSTVDVTVHNGGDTNATGFYVKLRDTTASSDLGTMGPYNLTANSSIDISFTWDLTGASGGKHTLQATADPTSDVTESDETDNTATVDVTVNLPPVANAASDMGFAYTGLEIGYSSAGSSDPDGTISNYLWYFGDGVTEEGYNVSHAYNDGEPTPGKTYNVTLVITDEDGGLASKTISVRIYNRIPTAKASDVTVNTMTPTSISGASSTDPDGKVTKFRWSLHNGSVLWGSPIVVSYADDGRYRIGLTVWDDDGESDAMAIYVTALNQAPGIDLRSNRTLVSKGDLIRFDASGSEDVDGVITDYTWIFGDSTTASSAVVDHAYSENGSYNVTLVLVDDDGAISYATIRVIVGNTAPLAVARASIGYVLTYDNVEFNASSSSDVDDNVATYAWDFGDGFSTMGKLVVHNFTDDGTYVVTLTVTDTAGAFATSTVTIVVDNRAPIAIFHDVTVTTHEPAWFNGTMCWDRDGYIASYLWDLGDGLVYSTANASHSWVSPGVHTVLLTIFDDDGAKNHTTFNVTVLNQAPIAVMTANPVKTTLARPVYFNGTISRDMDGEIINWTWAFGDGVKGYGDVVDHTYSSYGTYFATLTVRDNSGGINTTGLLITVRNQPPLAFINVTTLEAYTGDIVTFDGSNSSDPENQIAEYYWSFGDGDSSTGPIVTHVYQDDSWYTVRLTVVDQDTTASFIEVVVKVMNRVPIPKAEATPATARTQEEMTFKGTMSEDKDGQVLWFRWDFGDGTAGFGDIVDHAFSDDGTYTVTLTVTDDDGAEASHSIEIVVTNRAPFATAGDDQSTQTGIPVRFDGRQSYDPDGDIVEYLWDFGDETTTTGPAVTHSFPTYGTFLVELTVTDDDGATSTSNLSVTVLNVQPVAKFTGTTRILSGMDLELDATESYDLDGYIADSDYSWDMGDGKSELGSKIKHRYDSVGTYIVVLTVEDDGGLTSSYSRVIEVLNRMPSAHISASQLTLSTGDSLELDGSGSSDPDGSVEAYTWILGDGSVAYGRQVSHVYDDNGIYMVVLTITDDMEGTDSTSVFIQVENRPPMPAIASPDSVLTLMDAEFTAEGTLDPDGRIEGFFWDFGDGNAENGWNVSHEYLTSGIYSVRLTVLDDDGRSAFTSVSIEIINRPPTPEAETPLEATQNTTVRFDGTGSYDPDGLITAWQWDFGDDSTGEGREGYHRYIEAGTYTWALTVVDDSGDSQEISGSIYIKDRPQDPNIPGPDDDDPTEDSPGPGAIVALTTLALVGISIALRRKRQQA